MTQTWSPKQEAALKQVSEWFPNAKSKQVFRLFGFAGTGKTTLAKHFAASCGGQVLFAAYTGKAASVMRGNGCVNATTIHRLIYKPQPKSEVRLRELQEELTKVLAESEPSAEVIGRIKEEIKVIESDLKRPSFALNFESPVKFAKLVVVDECSMVGEQMAHDLMSFGVPILVLGDPAQLPPVGSAGFFTNGEPDAMLTEIHRQAQDSPIIRLATAVRNGESLRPGAYGEGEQQSLVLHRADFDADSVLSYDQILVGRNATRTSGNARLREILGRSSPLPEIGDKLVCLRNDHQVGLLNGEIWKALDVCPIDEDSLGLTIENDETKLTLNCEAHTATFLGREIDWRLRRQAQEFDYGYALTTHKAQGSQWGNVLVFDESRCFRADRQRWLYTAITRAANRVTILQGF